MRKTMMPTRLQNNKIRWLAKAYYIAKQSVLEKGFAPEVDWQYGVSLDHLNEETFLRETAWVILSSGMSEKSSKAKISCY